LVVRDDLEGAGSHRVELLFHAMPDVSFVPSSSENCYEIKGRSGRLTVRFLVADLPYGNLIQPHYRVVRGETDPIDGWYSHDYGCKEPASVLHVRLEGVCPIRIYAVFDADTVDESWATFSCAEEIWQKCLPQTRASFQEDHGVVTP